MRSPSPSHPQSPSISRLHALLEWQKNKDVPLKGSKSKLKADRPARSNYLNYNNYSGNNASCCAATGRKLLTSPGVADIYTFLMSTWNTLPESYQQRLFKNNLVIVKCLIQQPENPTPAKVISMEAAHVDNAILLDYLISKVELEEPEIGSTVPDLPIGNNCPDDELHFRMPVSSDNYDNEGDKIDENNDIPTASRRQQAAAELERFDLGTSDIDRYEADDGDDADADEEEDTSQADDGSTQNLEH